MRNPARDALSRAVARGKKIDWDVIAPPRITLKKYACKRCGHVAKQSTNHYRETYSMGHFNTCPSCPPWAKYPEFGGSTVWEYVKA